MAEGILCRNTILSTGSGVQLEAFYLYTHLFIHMLTVFNIHYPSTVGHTLCQASGPYGKGRSPGLKEPRVREKSGKEINAVEVANANWEHRQRALNLGPWAVRGGFQQAEGGP